MAATSRRILIIGGGPAGSVAAFFLGKAGFEVTVAERSTSRFAYGQGIDITGPALDIVKRMGVEQEIRANTTGEAGFAMLNDDSKNVAILPVASEAAKAEEGWKSLSLTQEIEITRGKLSKTLAEAADRIPSVTYRYGCTVSELRQSEKDVTVVLSDDGKTESFAAVIGADGLKSRLRDMIFGPETSAKAFKPVDQCGAFFSITGTDEDFPNSRWQHATKGRSIVVRPVDEKTKKVSGYVIQTVPDEKLKAVADGTKDEQKKALAEAFADFPGPLAPRIIEEMQKTQDFYFVQTAQIKLAKWHNGRCALVGDAAYAPSGVTGAGTLCAILGAYILAGELAANPDDPHTAFEKYHALLKDFITKTQQIPLGGKAPKLVNPQSSWGISILRAIFWFVAWSGVWKYANIANDSKFPLPEYEMRLPEAR
ncbi:Monooxygenase CTB7 [Pseudocercospora fuligena]|uniref:Monooxygenase CTB7 n=1 Tax=Pseudocercospora fuligena TaxID=685502 RepID=A0A8H6RAD5_9PEZI|nr:Monooxygenase CTB7 [Pseudocercospora fuligena]